MKPPLSLLVVHGDGSRVLRFSLPRWLAYGTLASLTAMAGIGIAFSGDWVHFAPQASEVAALRRHADNQSAMLDSFETRVAAVRGEIDTWKAVHARMWEAYGVEAPAVEGEESAAAPRGDELQLLASSVAEETPRLHELEEMTSRTGRIMAALPLRWPIRGRVNSEYGVRPSPWGGPKEHHKGIDIGSAAGAPVASPAPARVIAASSGGSFGKHVVLDHGYGVRSRYAHLRKLEVKRGDQVETGQIIGLVGSTGRSTGPHLHYEVLVQGKPVNPRDFLGDRPETLSRVVKNSESSAR